MGEGRQAQRVRRAYAQRETGKIDDAGYLEVVRDYVAEIVAEQSEAGVEVVTDGQVGWYDLVSHLAYPLDGIEIGGLLRFSDTNYLVRTPEIIGEVSGTIGLADDFRYLASVTSGTPKAVVTGPYTMARYSLIRSNGSDIASLAMQYAEVLGAEVAALADAGATIVQVEEPSLVAHPGDADLVRRALETVTKGKGSARISLVTYFGDAAPLYGELLKMPADILGFDLTYSPGLADLLVRETPDRPVAIGAIDGRNTKLDDVTQTARTVDRIAEALAAKGVDEVHLQPSCGLEYLPRDRALRKLERMRQIADACEKVGT